MRNWILTAIAGGVMAGAAALSASPASAQNLGPTLSQIKERGAIVIQAVCHKCGIWVEQDE